MTVAPRHSSRGSDFRRSFFFESRQVRAGHAFAKRRHRSQGDRHAGDTVPRDVSRQMKSPLSRLSITRCHAAVRLSRSTRPIYTRIEWNVSGTRRPTDEKKARIPRDGWIRNDGLFSVLARSIRSGTIAVFCARIRTASLIGSSLDRSPDLGEIYPLWRTGVHSGFACVG